VGPTARRRERLPAGGRRAWRLRSRSSPRPCSSTDPPELCATRQHTEEVLLELGLTWDEIVALRTAATSSEAR
jgi:hypothetical protein